VSNISTGIVVSVGVGAVLRVLDNKDDVNDMAEGEEFRRF
jgi:hypothetical protein